jgi:hypothetical protein
MTSAYRAGEFLYQDCLWDDNGGGPAYRWWYYTAIRTYEYPRNPAYRNNAADLVEVRLKPLDDATAIRVTYNTMTDPNLAAVTIALGGDPAQPADVPHGANTKMPAQVFVTAHGNEGDIVDAATGQPRPERPTVTADVERRQVDQLQRIVERTASSFSDSIQKEFSDEIRRAREGAAQRLGRELDRAVEHFSREAQSVLAERLAHVADAGGQRLERKLSQIGSSLEREQHELVAELQRRIGEAEVELRSHVKALAADADLVLVVGSHNSSNSRRLVEVAERHGAAARLIEDEAAIEPEWLADARTIGLTAGASAPEALVQRVLGALRALGADEIVERPTTLETVRFKVPAPADRRES